MSHRNLVAPTLGGQFFWTDSAMKEGWRVQRRALTGHARLIDAKNHRRGWGKLEEMLTALAKKAPAPRVRHANHAVVLVHGLGGNSLTFARMKRALMQDGHQVVSFKYASTMTQIADQAAALTKVLAGIEADTLTLIGQSMGGLVIDRALTIPDPRITGIIRIGTPCGGSQFAAAILKKVGAHPFRFSPLADVARGLGAEPASDALPHINIAGCLNGTRGLNPFIAGGDDGLVGIDEVTRHEADLTLVVPASHYTLTAHPQTIIAVRRFIGRAAPR